MAAEQDVVGDALFGKPHDDNAGGAPVVLDIGWSASSSSDSSSDADVESSQSESGRAVPRKQETRADHRTRRVCDGPFR